MAKIGRNDRCPCKSGKKYKHCCAARQGRPAPPPPQNSAQVTLMDGVRDLQREARLKRVVNRELGVFFLFATDQGDGWLLEMTQCDLVQVASGGEPLEPPIDENSETIEVNWSHTFTVRDKKLYAKAYSDGAESIIGAAPTKELSGAIRRIRKRFSPDQLAKVHLPNPEDPAA